MGPLGSRARDDGETLLVARRPGESWRAEGIDRTDLVVEAAGLDALRSEVAGAASERRRRERLEGRTWKVAYLWTLDAAPAPTGWFARLKNAFGGAASGPVFEVTPEPGGGYSAKSEDGSTVSGPTLEALSDQALARHRSRTPDGPPTVTLFEVIEMPAEVTSGEPT